MSIHRLHGLYRHATEGEKLEGARWYVNAAHECLIMAERVGRDVRVIAGVVAALSPNVWWERCLLDSLTLILGHKAGQPETGIIVTTYHSNRRKAWSILEGRDPESVLHGPKTSAFYLNLIGDWSVPCIDTHAINAWHGKRVVGSNLWLRRETTTVRKVTADYIRAAETLQLSPAEFQAIIWVSWKRRIKQGKVPGYK